ncbi:MAG: undecaprenyl/decaprenyl-phosphate alpha-N-acetylglucosaminyl 1-phosphate transferase [Caloramator sp.]|nr:undecaprenyl/decaprenyl-phosphate alpha-N-acetylglucosaminyl 1-phosphate transferase [Caloramator sp.]
MGYYFIVFLISGFISFILTPYVIKLANKIGAIDVPKDDRRVHKKPIPRMGGLSIYISCLVISLFTLKMNYRMFGLLFGATFIVFMGIIDDIKPLKPLTKLLVQIAAACILMLFDIRIKTLSLPFFGYDRYFDIGYFGMILTILWVVGVTNAMNLIDGLDGLACGTGIIASITLFIVSLISGRYLSAIMTITLAGASLGFLYYNFNPAKIFLGDTGSQFIGYMLASISILSAIKYYTAFSIFVPILAFGVPIYDTLSSIIRRKMNGKPIMEADRGHLHHRLLDKGFSHRQTVLIMYVFSVILGIISIVALMLPSSISIAVVCILFMFLLIYRKINK